MPSAINKGKKKGKKKAGKSSARRESKQKASAKIKNERIVEDLQKHGLHYISESAAMPVQRKEVDETARFMQSTRIS
jgi:hypothetical protein